MFKFAKMERYHNADNNADENNIERFGQPAYSLFFSTKIMSLTCHIDVTDSNETIVYKADTKAVSISDETKVTNAKGKQICSIIRKVLTMHARHVVSMADGNEFELSTELLHVIDTVTNIEGLGWKIKGNIIGLNYELYDADNQIIAVAGEKMISMHNKSCLDIYRPEYEEYAVAIMITFQHMIMDRKRATTVH